MEVPGRARRAILAGDHQGHALPRQPGLPPAPPRSQDTDPDLGFPERPGEGLNWRRYLLSLGVAGVAMLVADVALNAIVFRDVYARSASLFLPPRELNERVLFGWAALVVIVASLGLLLVKGDWLGFRGGLLGGLVLAVAGVAGVAGTASAVAWPPELLLAIGVKQLINGLLLGVVFGALYRRAQAE